MRSEERVNAHLVGLERRAMWKMEQTQCAAKCFAVEEVRNSVFELEARVESWMREVEGRVNV